MSTPDLLETLRTGPPLPLTDGQALRVAAAWRTKHSVAWRDLASLMGEYHGVWYSPTWWRMNCQRRYGLPVNPRRAEVMREMWDKGWVA